MFHKIVSSAKISLYTNPSVLGPDEHDPQKKKCKSVKREKLCFIELKLTLFCVALLNLAILFLEQTNISRL